MIGRRPVAEQQRILLALLAIGLIGLVGLALYSFFAARGGSTQVGATGQAMMQSQRLAKSVSQAIVGSVASFPEVKESAEVLATNVRNLKAGSAVRPSRSRSTRSCRWSTGPRRTPASSSRQQKALTEVGQSLRAINRQSFDLLEAAEAILSMKLQRDVNPIEISALEPGRHADAADRQVGQRIPHRRGRQPEAVFLLDKDLKSFNDITKGLLDGSTAMGLPGTRDPQVRERLLALVKSYQDTKNRGATILDQPARPERPRATPRRRSSATARRCARAWRRCRIGSRASRESARRRSSC